VSTHRRLLSLLALLLPLLPFVATSSAHAYGPRCSYDTVLNGQYKLIPLKNQAMISRERCGYRFRAGQQDSRLTVTSVKGGLRFHDRGTREWRSIPRACRRVPGVKGVAAVCPVPRDTSTRNPMLIEIWPRLGDDHVNTSDLPARFQVAALVDDGHDVVHLGAGNDFVNGAFDPDRVTGGSGNDWIRTGKGGDLIKGGPGHDRVVGVEGADVVGGGTGNDSVEGGPGADHVYTGDGADRALCGDGRDVATVRRGDTTRSCERVIRR
jgi:hypothetical protein